MTENVKLVLDQWVASLGQVIEAMTDTRPEIEWKPVAGAQDSDTQTLWWEQPFQFPPEGKVWVAAPRAAWEPAGTFTLKAAGLDTIELAEARNTWIEILGQSLSAMGRAISSVLGREVNCGTGVEHLPADQSAEWASVEIRLG